MLAFLPALVVPAAGRAPAWYLPGLNETVKAYSIGMGNSTARETYLSESTYSGFAFSSISDKWTGRAPEQMFGYDRIHSSLLFSYMNNPVGGGSTFQMMYDYSYAPVWNALHSSSQDLLLGPAGLGRLGVLYNEMNSNNPATVEAYLSAGVYVDYTWRFSLGHHGYALQASAGIPLLGIAFAPDYDQPYWFMYNYDQFDKALHMAWIGNNPALNGQVAAVFPIRSGRLRVGYEFDYMRNRLGGNLTRITGSQLTIGFIYLFEQKRWLH